MSLILFANNDSTTLAFPISNIDATATLASGTGALFPNPGAGQYFVLTFVSASNPLTREIVNCTARTGDVVTITRAQEGTTALAWNAGDLAANLMTAATMRALWQTSGGLSGVLNGTLPSPGMTAGAAAANVGSLGGVLNGALPNPSMAAGAAATNIGGLGGVLNGTLPNPGFARNLVNIQTFTSPGTYTYTPTAGVVWIVVEVQGGSGSSGGLQATTSSQWAASPGANAGAYAMWQGTPGSQSVAVGAGGTVVGPGAAGVNGGQSSFGGVVAGGGLGSIAGAATTSVVAPVGINPAPASASGGNIINMPGPVGTFSLGVAGVASVGGPGGVAPRGQAGTGASVLGASAGTNGNSGSGGFVMVWEFQ